MTVNRPKRLFKGIGVLTAIVAVCLLYIGLSTQKVVAATTLLPNGTQCFVGDGGQPLVNGSLNLYYPSTTTPKTTWTTSTQSSANANPLNLDANGCAILFGVGTYRLQVYDGPVSGG